MRLTGGSSLLLKRRFLYYHPFKTMAHGCLNPREIRIPVAYGFITAKAWGKSTSPPVLALHGWQDNAGTFDSLIPILASDLYIVAMDAPGHGRSCHKPNGAFYHFTEMLVDIQRVVEFLKWNTFSIIGHSLGGSVALLYSSVFSTRVQNLVLLDISKPASRDKKLIADKMRNGVESLLETERKMMECLEPPVYTVEEAVDRLCTGTYNQVTPDSAMILLKRGSKPSKCGKGVEFCRDIRVRNSESLVTFSHEELKSYLYRIKCNLLMIQADSSGFFSSATPEVLDEFLKIYEENCKSFKIVKVHGNHFVHLNNPERVASHIDSFFQTHCISNLSKI